MSTYRKLAIGFVVVLVITLSSPISLSENAPTQYVQKPLDLVPEIQESMIVTDDASLLKFSSYLGGNADETELSIDCDAAGNVYIAGTTMSNDFPLVNAFDFTFEGFGSEGFLTKINPNGTIIYSTYIGGNGNDEIHDIFVDDAGFVYLTGSTSSADFPTVNAYDSTVSNTDCFVCKINQAGTALIYSTYLGGLGFDYGRDIWVNDQGEAYIVGETNSGHFPTVNPYDDTHNGPEYQTDCFVSKLHSNGNVLLYSTYIGGYNYEEAGGIAVDVEGAIYVTGITYSVDFPTANAFDSTMTGGGDAFLLKLNPDGTSLNYSTFLGGEGYEKGYAIGLDSLGRSYVTGATSSGSFPRIRPIDNTYSHGEGFLTVFNPDGSSLNFSTYIGGIGSYEIGTDLVVNAIGSVYVCGQFSSNVSYAIRNPYDSSFNGGYDALLMRFDIDRGLVLFGSYLGGSQSELASSMSVGNDGIMYVCGQTQSDDFPLRNEIDSTYNPGGSEGWDSFVTAIRDNSDWDLDGIPGWEEVQLGTDSYNPDSDFDLLSDYIEVYQLGTSPLTNSTFGNGTLDGDLDHDGDMLTNVEELYEHNTDLLKWDSDLDFLGDGFEVYIAGSLPTEFDSDFDLLSDWDEYIIYNTNPRSNDTDLDLMTDYYEVTSGLNPLADDASEDKDGDSLTNLEEFFIGTFANNTDSDFDLLPDYWEVKYLTDPLSNDALMDYDRDALTNLDEYQYRCDPRNRDSDFDTLSDSYEIYTLGTNPLSNDSDSDSMPDSWEVEYGLKPRYDDSAQDLDRDGLTNLEEYEAGTRPDTMDTDYDSYSDAWELRNGFDPTNSHVSLIQIVYYNSPLIALHAALLITFYIIYRKDHQRRMKGKHNEQNLM